MKIKNILLFICCTVMTQYALALKIIVSNASSEEIGVDLVWAGRKAGYTQLKPVPISFLYDEADFIASECAYDSQLHHVQALLVKKSDGTYVMYTFEQGALRGTGTIKIHVGWKDDFSRILVTGYTDMVRQYATAVNLRVNAAKQ